MYTFFSFPQALPLQQQRPPGACFYAIPPLLHARLPPNTARPPQARTMCLWGKGLPHLLSPSGRVLHHFFQTFFNQPHTGPRAGVHVYLAV